MHVYGLCPEMCIRDSHQGDEYTKPEHVDIGADVLYQTVLKLDENGL